MSSRRIRSVLPLMIVFLVIGMLGFAQAQESLTLSVEPAAARSGDLVRIAVQGRPSSPLIIAASTANSGLGQLAGQEVLLGLDAFLLFSTATDAEGGFSARVSLPPGISGTLLFSGGPGPGV